MEGLRAPRIGTPFPQPARAVNPGRAAAAMAAAAVIGSSVGVTAVDANISPAGVLRNLGEQARTAPVSKLVSSSGDARLGQFVAQKAPSLGSVLPAAGKAIQETAGRSLTNSVGSGVGAGSLNGVGSTAAALGGAVVDGGGSGLLGGAAKLGGKLLSPLSPLSLFAPDLLFPEGTTKQKQEDEALKKARGEEGNKRDAERKKGHRKGDKLPTGIPNDGSKPTFGGQPGVQYELSTLIFGVTTGVVYAVAPWSAIQEGYDSVSGGTRWFIIDALGIERRLQTTVLQNQTAPTITGARPLNGIPDPAPKYTPQNPNDHSGGLNPNVALGNSPLLPVIPAVATNPSNPRTAPSSPANKLPNTGAPKPSDGLRTPTQPSTPTKAEPTKPGSTSDAPSIPLLPIPPIQGNTPGQGTQTITKPLAPLPTAPTTGSATSTIPLFPPSFTPEPGVRNQATFKPLQPEVPKPEEIKDPSGSCCKQTSSDLEEIKKVLGVGQYGVMLPLLTGDNPVKVDNLPDLLMYTNRNIDATQGLFPIKVKVKKGDGTEKTITLSDNAHALEELFSMCLTIAEDADAAVNIGARVATEVINTKIATMQGNDLIKALQKFIGFTVKPIAKVVKLNFSPTAAGANNKLENDEMDGFLKPSVRTYVGTDLAEKQELLPMVQRILHNSEIAMRAVWQPIKPGKNGQDDITGSRLRRNKDKPTKGEEETWKKLKETLKILGYDDVDDTGKLTSKKP